VIVGNTVLNEQIGRTDQRSALRLFHIKTRTMEEKINQILVYTLLAAKNVLTLDDVSLLTGLSKSHLYKLTCNHQIPHYKPNGKQLYFDRAEIEAWMKQGKVNTIDESEQMAAVYLAKASRK
jgi:excisionase family DNA binding protein